MLPKLEELRTKALHELAGASDIKQLEAWRVKYLGRNSELTSVLRGLAALSIEEKKTVGGRANEIKTVLADSFAQKEIEVKRSRLDSSPGDAIEITLPGRP